MLIQRNKPTKTTRKWEKGSLKMQTIGDNSLQIECDVVNKVDEWTEEALKFAKSRSISGKFQVAVIDAPHNNTG